MKAQANRAEAIPQAKIKESVSMVMPAFNEEDNIEFMLEESVKTLTSLTDDWEIVVVDDVSRDSTAQRAEAFAAKQPVGRIRVIRNPKNIGCHPSQIIGFKASRGDYCFFICSDRQILPRELYKFLPALQQGADLVYSWRLPRVDPFYRRLISKVYNLIEQLILGVKLHDSHSAIVAHRRVIDKIGPEIISDSAVIPVELVVRALKHNFQIAEVVIAHHPRIYGKATGINLKDVMRVPFDLYQFWRTVQQIRQEADQPAERAF